MEEKPTNEMFLESLGAAELRSGDVAGAAATLEKSRAEREKNSSACSLRTLLHLSLAHALAGDGKAARKHLDAAARDNPVEAELHWQDRLVWRMLRPEAERALEGVTETVQEPAP